MRDANTNQVSIGVVWTTNIMREEFCHFGSIILYRCNEKTDELSPLAILSTRGYRRRVEDYTHL